MQNYILPVLFVIVLGLLSFAIGKKFPLAYVSVFRLVICGLGIGYLINDSINGHASFGKYALMMLFIIGGAYTFYKQFLKHKHA